MNNFLSDIGPITWFVLAWLSIYFIANFWIFIWRFLKINDLLGNEKNSLELLSSNRTPMPKSTFYDLFNNDSGINEALLNVAKIKSIASITAGLSMLSVISSTAPFIGLFGTVVEILEAFYHLGGEGKVSFDIIAPIISKALIATAFGILTAIPAYSFYILLKRKAYEFSNCLDMQISLILQDLHSTKITLKAN